jgi:predicted  nucleic acid-binding Zn-ribbon protein
LGSTVDKNGDIDFSQIEVRYEERIGEKNKILKNQSAERDEINKRLVKMKEENKEFVERAAVEEV